MANVVTQEGKKKLDRMFVARILLVVSACAVTVAFFMALSVMPTFLTFYFGSPEIFGATPTSTPSIREDRSALSATKKRITALKSISKNASFSVFLERAVALRPAGMRITSVVYSMKEGSVSVSLSGSAQSQKDVQMYVQELRSLSEVKDANIPITTLSRLQEGTFSIVVIGNF